jgi:hypothetical protein
LTIVKCDKCLETLRLLACPRYGLKGVTLIEVHVVTESNASDYSEEMASYHRWRHLIYVEERGWSDLRKPDGLERDQFDTAAAVHLLAMEGGEVVGGSRLMPASGPTILSEVFPYLCERGEPPRDAETLDWTRMFVVPSKGSPTQADGAGGALRGCDGLCRLRWCSADGRRYGDLLAPALCIDRLAGACPRSAPGHSSRSARSS